MARILVAEDDQFTREIVQRALEAAGHQVLAAEDGSEALAATEGGASFDLVVTDVEMPGISGLELAEQILKRNPSQKILVMSGLADELNRAKALKSPNVRLITKPVTIDTIKAETGKLLAGN